MHVFVYEYACAQADNADLPAPIHREGRAMLDAIAEDFGRVDGVEALTLPPQTGGQEEAAFKTLAKAADWSLVIGPEFDQILERRCRWVRQAGGRLLGPSPSTVRRVADKWRMARKLERALVPVPRTWLALPQFQADWPAPCVRKRRCGAGSLDTQLFSDPGTIQPTPIHLVQEYVPGQPASVAFLIGSQHVIPLAPATQELSQDGKFQYLGGDLPLREDLAERATSLALRAVRAVLGLRGYVGVDLVLGGAADGSEDRVIEINPRLTTSYIGLRALADANLAEVMLRLAEGDAVDGLCWHPGRVRFEAGGTVEFVG